MRPAETGRGMKPGEAISPQGLIGALKLGA
jgi:hypothetical protein